MKPSDRVRFLEWNDSLRNVELDPNAKWSEGIILEILFHYAGYEVRIQTDDGRILDLHEAVHNVEVIET